MLEAYSINQAVGADSAIPFNSVSIRKGCTAVPNGVSTIELNKAGVYMVEFDGTASASTLVQLYKNGIAQPQAQSTGETVGFTTLVQVPSDNSCKCCASPVTLQIMNETAGTFTNANITITKVC